MVLMAWRGIELDEVAAELARREGTSGLVEKASRPAKKDSGTADS
jgi:phosphoribosyl-ATP pyrophosphohydrolase